MKLRVILMVMALGCAGCASNLKIVRTPPGTSVEVALAKRAEAIRLPATVVTTPSASPSISPGIPATGAVTHVPAVEPDLPSHDSSGSVAEAYTRGQFCMKAGAEAEAIAAFHEAVKLDANFTDAWYALAALYERQGETEKSMEAFRNAKRIAQH